MPTNIDEEFAEAMRFIGGKRPAEINPDVSKTLNADIILPDDDVILECWCLGPKPKKSSNKCLNLLIYILGTLKQGCAVIGFDWKP